MSERTSGEIQENFEELLAQHDAQAPKLQVGQKVKGPIIAITTDSVFVDVGRKQDGVLDRAELIDVEGNDTSEVGREVEAWIVGMGPQGIVLSRSMTGSGMAALEEALDARLPVNGRVKGTCKGGYQVELLGKTAFCPGSQMPQCQDPEEMVGKQLQFLITRIENHGRNIVVSHRALLEMERQENLDKLLSNLIIGDTVEGKVSRLVPFGAFIELAQGVEGLVHLSELSWTRVGAPDEAVSVDDQVRVKVLGINRDEKGQTRISLSIKQAQGDPWASLKDRFAPGDVVEGRVRRLAPFGAFVEIAPGVEGLAHISEMSWAKRVTKPEDVVSAGELVQVKIMEINPDTRRISLSLREALGDPWADAGEKFAPGVRVAGTIESKSPHGFFINLAPGITALLPQSVIRNAPDSAQLLKLNAGDPLTVVVRSLDVAAKRIGVAIAGEEKPEGEKAWQNYARPSDSGDSANFGIMASALQKAMQKK